VNGVTGLREGSIGGELGDFIPSSITPAIMSLNLGGGFIGLYETTKGLSTRL
jgi:hypothetical protein